MFTTTIRTRCTLAKPKASETALICPADYSGMCTESRVQRDHRQRIGGDLCVYFWTEVDRNGEGKFSARLLKQFGYILFVASQSILDLRP